MIQYPSRKLSRKLAETVFLAAVLVVMSFASHVSAADLAYDRGNPPVLLIHQKIQKAGIPIVGVSGWPVERLDFSPEATTEQKQAAWDIANHFDYQKALKEAKAGEGMITAYGDQIPQLGEDGQISVATVNGMPYLYFQANGETHHILGESSFEISAKETIDALSGEKMQVGDFVIGMIDKSLDNGTDGQDSSMHGIWVKWSSVKKDLIEELKANMAGFDGGDVSGVSGVSLAQKFLEFGISLKDGITHIAQLAVDKFYAKTARIEKLEFVDQATGEVYCTWIENGVDHKEKGECPSDTVEQPVVPPPVPVPVDEPVIEAPPVVQEEPASDQPEGNAEAPAIEQPAVEQAPQQTQESALAPEAPAPDPNPTTQPQP